MPFDCVFGDPKYDVEKCYISSRASLIGQIIIEEEVIAAPGVRLRADEGAPFKICRGTNIQDGVVMHGLLNKYVEEGGKKFSIWIGSHCSLAHKAMIHGPTKIGKHSFIGFMAEVHYSTLGRNCFVRSRATIENSTIGSNCYIGIGAIIDGVKIADGRYVESGQVVICQEQADLLPDVPNKVREKCNHFNQEVVDYNKKLIKLYKERRSRRRFWNRVARLIGGLCSRTKK